MRLGAVLPQKYLIESLYDMRDHHLHRYGVACVVRQCAVGIGNGFKFELAICLQGKSCDCTWLTPGELWNYREAKEFVLVRKRNSLFVLPLLLLQFNRMIAPALLWGDLPRGDRRRYRSLSIQILCEPRELIAWSVFPCRIPALCRNNRLASVCCSLVFKHRSTTEKLLHHEMLTISYDPSIIHML
jgi:hypothetical protein